ncbi:DUF6973 domain-containing protein [Treponema pedis]|uniref:DUF6973 domain-containing protein n=1 Tax=Treponema pedis TaxID=409322 RepID=UPI00040D4D17|nr:hypothetical protein [Treponema pedis]
MRQSRTSSKIWAWLKHPIAATNVGRARDGGSNISSVATNFTINLSLSWAYYDKVKRDEGSERGAFRHALWQSIIASKDGFSVATDIGNGHDKDILKINKPPYADLESADAFADQLNNIIGRGIGLDNTNASPSESAKMVLDEFHTNGLFTVTKNEDGSYGVQYTQLSKEDYDYAIGILNKLNEKGLINK